MVWCQRDVVPPLVLSMLHATCGMKWVRNSCCRKSLPNTVWWGQWSPETPLAELFYTYLLNCLFNCWTQVQQILPSPCQQGGGDAAPADSGADASVRLAGRTASTQLSSLLKLNLTDMKHFASCIEYWVDAFGHLYTHGLIFSTIVPLRL